MNNRVMSMMKNFTKILLGLAAIAAPVSIHSMEWRDVVTMDFGGNDENADAICNTKPSSDEVETDLEWIGQKSMMAAGKYMIIKATQLADVGKGYNLTNWGTAVLGQPKWAEGGDHTNSDPNIGYYMVFDCPQKSQVKLYKKPLPVSCSGVEFKLEAYLAALDCENTAANTVRVSIIGGGRTLQQETLNLKTPSSTKKISWEKLSTTFKVEESNITSVDFLVEAVDCMSSGYDIAMDDITISVNQPKLTISSSKFYYQDTASITAEYDQTEFFNFFGGSYSDVMYKWYKKNETTSEFEEISGASGDYTEGSNMKYKIESFDKNKDNGTYRLVVSTKDNFGNNLCSIQKEYEVKEDKNIIYVVMCKDSTITTKYGDVLSTKEADDQVVEILGKDYKYEIKCIPFIPLETEYIPQCMNAQYPTPGNIRIEDYIERESEYGCPTKVQPRYIKVEEGNVKDDPKHLCEGDKYITDDNVDKYYTEVDESGQIHIAFDSEGCRHEQYIFVHPKKAEDVDVTVCKGDSYDGVPYNKEGTYKGTAIKLKTIWGCDSIITPTIEVVEPVEVTKSATVCPSDNYEFAGKVYNYPIDTTIVETIKGGASNGCDSTTKLHLVVNEGGVVNMDTLICREQILFGDSFMVAGTFTKKISGFTESGCPRDTIWTINVVEISLRLRLFNNQDQVCYGQPSSMNVTLKAYEPNGKVLTPTYHWDPEVPSNVLSPTLYLNETTTYTIYADLNLPSDIDKNAKGCHAKESVKITVNPIPELSIDSINPEDRSVEYTVTGGTMPYHVYLGSKDLGFIETNTDKKDRLPYGEHILQVQDSTGCAAEQEIVIKAIEPEPDIFFSPNGDGENDFWRIKNLNAYKNANSAIVRIYDRFGKLIYSANGADFESGWDGTYNGNKMPATDYWYEIDIDDIDKQYFGHFTLIR
ncbi:MAG: T9SS type B sorting domain-containing protein [Bacteroidales bacterium]|jgi:gliding motility-associated-like protein|nr:T9SS type B sorting domain-containing protein [Bacteroidales bacterium]